MPDDPYSDPVTGVLRNKLGLGTAAGLEAAELDITHAALILLHESPVAATYDLLHLREIHRRIFRDIYEWAGQIRTGAMFGELGDENFLRGLTRDAFIERLAYYLSEVNALHPFREGNGRTQRAFFGQLARDAGFALGWQRLDAARNIEAAVASMRGDLEPMRKLLDTLVRDGT